MSPTTAWAVLFGLTFGFGAWSLVSLIPLLDRPRLLHRVAPYVVDISPAARELLSRRAVDPLPVLGTVLTPLTTRARRTIDSVFGGSVELRVRLRQAGSTLSAEQFRARQLSSGILGLIGGVAASAVIGAVTTPPPGALVGVTVAAGVTAVVALDYRLQRTARARLDRMTNELPTVLEFLTLSLSAGEGILDAIRRVSRISRGELSVELATTVADANTGVPFGESLARLADTVRLPALSRAVEQILGALDRGTPLAEVLRAQAQDARDDAKRRLLETAGKKEVAMLVPLVFLILPTTIVFAIFPGIFVLQLGF
ncbi:type II secretion system F family protein [Marisediminicola sp. LYQ134]|uniref:type II secretion system F family protein n=1 Tax=unclassified Marisediminicola TaxID=2618316 RepID=UPI003983825A